MAWDKSEEHYFSGQGIVLLAKRGSTGQALGFRPVGNVPDCKINLNVEIDDHKESKTGIRGIDKRLRKSITGKVDFTMENFLSENLAMQLNAGRTSMASGTKTGLVIRGYKGLVTSLDHLNLSGLVVKTEEATPRTLTKFPGTGNGKWDYQENLPAGSIMLNPDVATFDNLLVGDLVEDPGDAGVMSVPLTAAFSYSSQFIVDALTGAPPDLWLRFEGLNTAEDNVPVVVDIFRIAADPLKELALIGNSLQSSTMSCVMQMDSYRTSGSPYFQIRTVK